MMLQAWWINDLWLAFSRYYLYDVFIVVYNSICLKMFNTYAKLVIICYCVTCFVFSQTVWHIMFSNPLNILRACLFRLTTLCIFWSMYVIQQLIYLKLWATGHARNDKNTPRQKHRHGAHCLSKKTLAAGQLFKIQGRRQTTTKKWGCSRNTLKKCRILFRSS